MTTQPSKNHLLASLPVEEFSRWLSKLELVEMPVGRILYESGTVVRYVYFPTTSIVSVIYELQNGYSSEIAVIGYEGAVGISVFMGGTSMPNRAVVQSAGLAYRMKEQTVRDELAIPAIMNLFLRYTMSRISEISLIAVCNRHHSIEQQVCRCMLLSLDRLQGSELLMTQELIALMLGVRRESVTVIALMLQKAGLIKYARGHISVLDRDGIEARSCECYFVGRNEYERLLPGCPHEYEFPNRIFQKSNTRQEKSVVAAR